MRRYDAQTRQRDSNGAALRLGNDNEWRLGAAIAAQAAYRAAAAASRGISYIAHQQRLFVACFGAGGGSFRITAITAASARGINVAFAAARNRRNLGIAAAATRNMTPGARRRRGGNRHLGRRRRRRQRGRVKAASAARRRRVAHPYQSA